MRASEAEILIIPGLAGRGWTIGRAAGNQSFAPHAVSFSKIGIGPRLPPGAGASSKKWSAPSIRSLVAHSLGVLAAAHSAPLLARGTNGSKVKGAFMVAPPSQNILSIFDAVDPAFLTLPVEPLAFPTVLIASRDDKYSSFADSEALAKVLGAKLVDAGFSGHINSESGHGPWPEGLMCLATFLKTL